MNKFILPFLSVIAFGATVFAVPVAADTQCTPIYGGGQNCVQTDQLTIDKTVQNPSTKDFVNNLGVNDPKYGPDDTVLFQITVKNNTSAALTNVKVTDVFPQFIDYVSGGQTFDSNTKTMTLTIDTINAGETKTFQITGKVVSSNALPSDRGITCVINQAAATVGNGLSQDNAQLCIEKNVLGVTPTGTPSTTTKGGLQVFPAPVVTQTPPTGPEALAVFALLPSGVAGFFLRRKASK